MPRRSIKRPFQEFDPGASPPPPPAQDDTDRRRPSPIGIPEDYPIPGGAQRTGMEAGLEYAGRPYGRYNTGDEMLPANYSADRIVQIQTALEQVGFLSQGSYSLGIWDPATINAYTDLLGLSNARGQNAEQTLNEFLAIVEAGGGPLGAGQDVPPLITQQTSPEELEPVFRRTAIEMTGRGWDAQQIQSAISAYNQIETQRQTEAYNAQYLEGGGTVQSIPSPEAFIESRIGAEEPEEVAVETGLGFIGDFLNMATGPAWGGS